MKRIAIIGGGAAGLAAAVAAAEAGHVQVVVFESADRVGKSILASGNGRCNFSNTHVAADLYHNAGFVARTFKTLRPEEVWDFFAGLGLLWHAEREGWMYPLTNKASTVLDVLRFAAAERGVQERCGEEVIAVTPTGRQFLVTCDNDQAAFFDAAIVACGGKVARSILPQGYRYVNTVPTLGPILTDTRPIRGLNNIRVRAALSTGDNGERGEILFREYGVSGIAAFNLSRFVQAGDVIAIDFLPDYACDQLDTLLEERHRQVGARPAEGLLAGMLQPPVARAVLKAAGLDPKCPLQSFELAKICGLFKEFKLTAEGIGDPRACQVQRGGFAVGQFDPTTLSSERDQGLYVAGEALDVDAPCGGYNLHWAWTSGILAGRAASARLSQGEIGMWHKRV